MQDRWDDPDFAEEWDHMAPVGNPSRLEHLDLLITILEHYCAPDDKILDLGIGSALLEADLFARRPDLFVVGVDASESMIALAKKRLSALDIPSQRWHLIQHDLSDIRTLSLLEEAYQAVISVQTLHHLPYEAQQDIFRIAHKLLDDNGIFLVLDRIQIDVERLNSVYRVMWNWLESKSPVKSGWTSTYFLERLRNKDDHPVRLEDQIVWLRQAGFAASCLHLCLDRALVAGVKTEMPQILTGQ